MKAGKNAMSVLAMAIAIGFVSGAISTARGELLFYEGFDYGEGPLNGTNGWSAAGSCSILSSTAQGAGWSNGDFVGVTQTGLFAGGNNIQGNLPLDPSVTATFTDGSTTWLSWIAIFLDSRYATVAVGKGTWSTRAQNASAGGQDIGGGSRYNNASARPSTWNTAHAYGDAIPNPAGVPRFLVAKIVWAPNGSSDTVTLAGFASGDTITEAAFDAKVLSGDAKSTTADLDQSTFEDLNIATSRNNFLDEIRIATTFEDAVTGLPTPPPPPAGAITWSDAGVTNITADAATATATLGGTNAEVTLYWKKGSSAPQQFTGWDGTNNAPAGLIATGLVQRAMTGLDADTLYSCIFYGTNSAAISNAWSTAVEFSTALTAAQTPVFTSAVVGQGSVTLGWTDNASNETGYVLQRAAGAGPYSVITDTLVPGTVSYVDGGLAIGTYSYRLAATNAGNGSATAFTACETNATVTEAVPGLLFYEGFDYGEGPLNGTNGWSASGLNIVSSTAQGAGWNNTDFVGVDQTGLFAGGNNAEGNIALDPSVTSTFAEGTTTWLSWIAISVDSRWPVAAIGTGTFNDRAGTATGQNIGGGSIFSSGPANPSIWNTAHTLGPAITIPASSLPARFMVAKIEWGAGGSDDTVTLAAFASGDTITETAFDAKVGSGDAESLAADLDQSTFEDLNIATSRNNFLDEIRIATTFEDAVTGPPTPPSGTGTIFVIK